MPDLEKQIEDLLAEAGGLEHGPVQLAIIERAVDLADSHGDLDLSFEARSSLVESASFSGRPDVALVAFSWLSAKFDEHPGRFNSYQFLWQYKWILGFAPDFPTIGRDQLDELYDDMKRRYKAEGSTLHAYWTIRRDNAPSLGSDAEGKKAHAKLMKTGEDHLSNCAACVQDGTVGYFAGIGDDAGALKAAKPIFKGKLTCAEVPEHTYANVVLPLIRLGKHEQALEYFRIGYKLIDRNPDFVVQKSMYLVALTLTGNLSRAVKLLDRHLPEAIESVNPMWRFEFFLAVRLLLQTLAQNGKKTVPVRLPKSMNLDTGDAKPTVAALIVWIDARLKELATAFDARNGNKSFAKRVRKFDELLAYAKPCPL